MELNLTSGTLEEQINFLKTIFDSIPFPIFIKNLNLEYVYTNRICAEKNGVKPEELVGKSDADLWYESLPLVDEYNENDFEFFRRNRGELCEAFLLQIEECLHRAVADLVELLVRQLQLQKP
ncbi:MAG: PAS domain-containing protein, partial [Treponema sp.]|nr:PAS domain-containing protein [Treponema sp.]